MVKMKTLVDSLHISNVGPDNLAEGAIIEVGETEAQQLDNAGRAERVGGSSKALNADRVVADRPDTREEIDAERGEQRPISAKSVAAPANKQVEITSNKAAPAARKSK